MHGIGGDKERTDEKSITGDAQLHTRRRCTPGKNCVTCSAKFLHLAITLGGCILISSILSHICLSYIVYFNPCDCTSYRCYAESSNYIGITLFVDVLVSVIAQLLNAFMLSPSLWIAPHVHLSLYMLIASHRSCCNFSWKKFPRQVCSGW